jgi:hypothetical protein
VGSRTKTQEHLAYIAGFLDGDGSIMAQVKNRRDTPRGWRVMLTICLYQDTRHEEPLLWMRKVFGIGYISQRKDGMTEYRINGFNSTERVLIALKPFVRFKKKQVRLALQLAPLLKSKKFSEFSQQEKLKIANLVCDIRDENYKSGIRKYTREQIRSLLGA